MGGICEEYDSCLCTKDELSRGCTGGSGCSMDGQLIWSGTLVASDPVSPAPSNAPTDSSPTDESEYYVVCGKGTGCRNGVDEAVADVSELHEVRCCKDERTSVFKTNRCQGVWAASELGGSCHPEKTYDEAKGNCEEYDSRLCTKDELSRGCTRGSGCSMDGQLIWSGTPVASDPVSPSPSNAPTDSSPTDESEYYVVCGKGRGCNEGNEVLALASELHEVRCCKDEDAPGFKTRCDNVWAASELGGSCHREKTYDEAKGICEEYDSRLCTKEEISGQCTRGSGCSLDGHLVWSGTSVE